MCVCAVSQPLQSLSSSQLWSLSSSCSQISSLQSLLFSEMTSRGLCSAQVNCPVLHLHLRPDTKCCPAHRTMMCCIFKSSFKNYLFCWNRSLNLKCEYWFSVKVKMRKCYICVCSFPHQVARCRCVTTRRCVCSVSATTCCS